MKLTEKQLLNLLDHINELDDQVGIEPKAKGEISDAVNAALMELENSENAEQTSEKTQTEREVELANVILP